MKNAMILCVLSAMIAGCASTNPTAAQRWEYKRVDSHPVGSFTQARLDEIANEGWEIVGFSNTVDASGGHYSEMILKRPRTTR